MCFSRMSVMNRWLAWMIPTQRKLWRSLTFLFQRAVKVRQEIADMAQIGVNRPGTADGVNKLVTANRVKKVGTKCSKVCTHLGM